MPFCVRAGNIPEPSATSSIDVGKFATRRGTNETSSLFIYTSRSFRGAHHNFDNALVFAVRSIRDVEGQRLASKGGRQRRGGGARAAGRVDRSQLDQRR